MRLFGMIRNNELHRISLYLKILQRYTADANTINQNFQKVCKKRPRPRSRPRPRPRTRVLLTPFYSSKNSGLNYRNFRTSNGTVFSRPDLSCSIYILLLLGNITLQDLPVKMPKDQDKVAVLGAVSWLSLEICELFSLAIMQTEQMPAGNSEQPVHNFPQKQILTFLWRIGNQ